MTCLLVWLVRENEKGLDPGVQIFTMTSTNGLETYFINEINSDSSGHYGLREILLLPILRLQKNPKLVSLIVLVAAVEQICCQFDEFHWFSP